MLRAIFGRHGITPIAIGITLIAVVLSLGITWSVHTLFGSHSFRDDLIIAVIAALVLAPLFSIPILHFLQQSYKTEQQLQILSFTDELTQIYNRRYFMQYLNQEFRRVQRSRDIFSIAILDLDNFKEINDQFGHPAGDRILQEITRVFSESIRQADILARYGGDEFIFLFPGMNRQQTLNWAARIYATFANTSIQINDLDIHPLFSMGAAVLDSSVDNPDALLKKADDSLYRAKRLGGNQVVLQ